MKLLSRSEELLLLAIWKLQGNAYGVTIREELQNVTGKTWAFGALFITLERMAAKGLIQSFLSDPTPERGGRSKRIYSLTQDGKRELIEIKKIEAAMWANIPELSLER